MRETVGGGVRVRSVARNSPAFAAGIRGGDCIVGVNEQLVHDELDCRFLCADSMLVFTVVRRGRRLRINCPRPDGSWLGLNFHSTPVRCCRNKCLFCFVDQLPPGLRSSLYVKDEDYRHSFLYGNYITLTGMAGSDIDHCAQMGYSPLYISVHATDHGVRLKLLGVRRAPDVLDQLRALASRGVSFHTQLVICPGINDGVVLDKSLSDLTRLGARLLSVAVVPVGLTKFRSGLRPVDASCARSCIDSATAIGDQDARRQGRRRVFCADEFYVKSRCALPATSWYEGFPQIENGVGLLRSLLDDWRRLRRTLGRACVCGTATRCTPLTIITSVSACACLRRVVASMAKYCGCTQVRVVPVINRFLGESVTVAGLIGGADTVRMLGSLEPAPGQVVLPAVMFNSSGHTLDGWSLRRIGNSCKSTMSVAATVRKLYDIMSAEGASDS